MTHFLTSRFICWRDDALFDVMPHFLTSWRTFCRHDVFLTSRRTFWRHDAIVYFWRHDENFDVIMYLWDHDYFSGHANFLTDFWRHDELFDIMTHSLSFHKYLMSWRSFDVMTYFWCHDGLIDAKTYFLRTFWHHEVFLTPWFNFDVTTKRVCSLMYFWRNDECFYEPYDIMIILDVMLHFWTSWLTLWRHDEHFNVMIHFWRHDINVQNPYWRQKVCIFYIWCYDVFFNSWCNFDVTTNFLMSWRTFWCHDWILTYWKTFWRHDIFFTTKLTFWNHEFFT